MGSLFGSKPKISSASAVPSVLNVPKAKEVPKPVVIPVEDAETTEAARRKAMLQAQQRGGLASTTLAEDKLG